MEPIQESLPSSKQASNQVPEIQLIGIPRRNSPLSEQLNFDQPVILLTLLASAEKGMSRQVICELMYPDADPLQARQRLRQVLYRIRQQGLAHQWVNDRERLQWLEGSDLHQLKQAIRHDDVAAIHHLYPQDLLEGFSDFDTPFGAWLSFERTALLHTWIEATLRHAQNLLEEKAFEACTTLLVTLLNRDPLQETALLTLFKCTEHTQQYHLASLHYEKYIQHLKSELGLQPPLAIERAHQQLSNHQQMHPIPLSVGRSALVGRQKELQQLNVLLQQPEVKLISILGPGGIGKTSLAQELQRQFHLPVTFVDCVPFSCQHSLLDQLAAALNLSLHEGPRTLLDHFRQHPQVLILDNVEHLLPELTRLLQDLLQVPTLKLLVTTRTRLQMAQEHVLELHGLEHHQNTHHPTAKRSQAAELFMRVVLRQHSNCRLDASEERTIEQICEQLQGLPLAIELAAAWCRLIPVRDLKAQLDFDLNFLEGSLAGLPERHQSLRTVFEHSWKLLGTDAQHTLKMLSVFPGSFTPQAALRLAGKSHLQLLQLLDQSLLKRNASEKQRLELHPAIREFAFSLLQKDALASEQAHQNLLHHAEDVLQQHPLRNTSNQKASLQAITLEYPNLMAALTWATSRSHTEQALKLTIHLAVFWEIRELSQQGLRCIQDILATAAHPIDPPLLTEACLVSGTMHWSSGSLKEAKQDFLQALQLSQQHHLPVLERRAHSNLGAIHYHLRDVHLARQHMIASVQCAERLGERAQAAVALNNIAVVSLLERCFEDVRPYATESLNCARAQGNHSLVSNNLGLLGILELLEENLDAAQHHLSECLEIIESTGNQQQLAIFLYYAGVLQHRQNRPESLTSFMRHLCANLHEPDELQVISTIEHLCLLLHGRGQKDLAASWWSAAQSLKQQTTDLDIHSGLWLFKVSWPEPHPPQNQGQVHWTLEALMQDIVQALQQQTVASG